MFTGVLLFVLLHLLPHNINRLSAGVRFLEISEIGFHSSAWALAPADSQGQEKRTEVEHRDKKKKKLGKDFSFPIELDTQPKRLPKASRYLC